MSQISGKSSSLDIGQILDCEYLSSLYMFGGEALLWVVMFYDFFLIKKNLLLDNKVSSSLANSTNHLIVWVRTSGRIQPCGLSLIHMMSVVVPGAGGFTPKIASSLLHLVLGLGVLTVDAGSWQETQWGLLVWALTHGLSDVLALLSAWQLGFQREWSQKV